MIRSARALLAASLLAALATPAAAQEAGHIDASLLFRYSLLEDAAASEPGIGIGGRFGVFMWKNIALEVTHAASRTADDPEARQGSLHMHLARHHELAENWIGIIGAGWVRDRTNAVAPTGLLSSDGASVIAGLQRNISPRAALRVDAIYDYIPVAQFDAARSSASHLHFQVGLAFRFPQADSDGDGVINRNDGCANTPAGAPVDDRGCPLDADRDGVSDNADRCANTPAGTPVDANGCPRDTDGDGVLDNADRCPNTPAGTPVTAEGCPRDADADNVPDNLDRCPNTPAGTRVDANGCQLVFEEGQRNIVLEGVNFETGRAVLTAESQSILDRVAESLVASPEVNIEVQGHTDNTGSVAGNNRISQARADAVRNYLISKGVAANRLTARGYGPSQPAASNATAAGRAQNRRVELRRTN